MKLTELLKKITSKSDESKSGSYLTTQEIRSIAKENAKIMRRLEKYK